MDPIQIKSYLTAKQLPGGYEIRRFELELPPTGSFGLLVTRLLDLYSGIIEEEDELKVCWLDEENEQVGFRSDAELEYAVNYQRKKKKKRICSPFSSGNSEVTLRVYIWTRSSMSVFTPNARKATKDEFKKIGRNALKAAGKDLNYLRTHNVKLLKPGGISRKPTPASPESSDQTESEPVIPVTAGWYDVEPASDASLVDNHITLDSLDVASSAGGNETESLDEQLKYDIQRIKEDPALDEEEKADKILKVNVKYYISGLLDAVCRE